MSADARATTPEEAIAYLNQQRAAYGISPVELDQSLLKPECNMATHEIASPSTSWSSSRSPWDGAPFHEETLFDPSSVAAAYGEYDHFGSSAGTWACMWFRRATRTPAFYWAAEASGPNAVPPAVYANEIPSSPAEQLGLSEPTGPNLIVYASSFASHPAAVSAAVVDASGNPVPARLAYDEAGSAVLVVESPVKADAHFDVTVSWKGTEYVGPPIWEVEPSYLQSFSFTTGLSSIGVGVKPSLALANGGRMGRKVRVWIDADPVLVGRQVELSFAVLQHRCGKQRKPPRPGCGWGTVRRRERRPLLTQQRSSVLVPRPTPNRKVRVRVRTRPFVSSAGRVEAANALLELRAPRRSRR